MRHSIIISSNYNSKIHPLPPQILLQFKFGYDAFIFGKKVLISSVHFSSNRTNAH